MPYPSSLPASTIDGYAVRAGSVIARVGDNTGATTQRRRVVEAPSSVSARWVFTGAQLSTFREWFDSIHGGASWSDIKATFGVGIRTVSIRFVESYEATIIAGDRWEVTAQLELRSIPLITEEELDGILDGTSGLDPDIVEDMSMRLHQYVHVDRPTIYIWEYNG